MAGEGIKNAYCVKIVVIVMSAPPAVYLPSWVTHSIAVAGLKPE
jgi:hypothetical protein